MAHLIIRVEEALALPSQALTCMDPYARITIDGVIHETRAHNNGGGAPAWKQELPSFPIRNALGTTMHVQLFDKDLWPRTDKYICGGSCPLSLFQDGEPQEMWLPLIPAGQIKVSVVMKSLIVRVCAAYDLPEKPKEEGLVDHITQDLSMIRNKVRPRTGFRNTMFEFVTGSRRSFRDACENGNIAEVMKLHQQGQDIESMSNFGATALHKACARGQLEIVKYLLENGADPNATHKGGKTPQQEAEANSQMEVVHYLQEQIAAMSIEEQQHRNQLRQRRQVAQQQGRVAQQQQGFSIEDNVEDDLHGDPNAHQIPSGHAPWEWSGLYAKVTVGDHEQCTDALMDDDETPLDPLCPEWDELLEPFAVRSSVVSTMAHVALFDRRSHLLGQGRRDGDLFIGRASLPLVSLVGGQLHELTLDLVPSGQLKVRVLLASPAVQQTDATMFEAAAASFDPAMDLHLEQPLSQPPSPNAPASPSIITSPLPAASISRAAHLFAASEETRQVYSKLQQARDEAAREAERGDTAEAELQSEKARAERERAKAGRAEKELKKEKARMRQGQSQDVQRGQDLADKRVQEAMDERDREHATLLVREQELQQEKRKSAKLHNQLATLKAQYGEELAKQRRKLVELQAQLEAKGGHAPAAAAAAAAAATIPVAGPSVLPAGSSWANMAKKQGPVKKLDDASLSQVGKNLLAGGMDSKGKVDTAPAAKARMDKKACKPSTAELKDIATAVQ
jgi:hypothetical protein